MSASDDDDLDGILDSALDNFQVDDGDTITPIPESSGKAGAGVAPTNENVDANGNTNGNTSEEAALRAFREALSKPLESSGDAAEEEMDMQLIEQFMKSLESMHSAAPSNSNGNANASDNDDISGVDQPGENFIKALIGDFLSKNVLIEPITQVKQGIGAYLQEHPDIDISPGSDGERYRRQHNFASELVDELDGAARPQRIIELLASLKDCGKFPDGIIDGLPDPDSLGGGGLNGEDDDGELGADIAAMTEACKLQ